MAHKIWRIQGVIQLEKSRILSYKNLTVEWSKAPIRLILVILHVCTDEKELEIALISTWAIYIYIHTV